MDRLLTILTFLFAQSAFAQLGVIVDGDGFVHVRRSPGILEEVVGQVNSGEVVFGLEKEGDWWWVDYETERWRIDETVKTGYIHASKIQWIDQFPELEVNQVSECSLRIETGEIKLYMSKTRFFPEDHQLAYRGDGTSGILEKIDGQEVWGTEGNIPWYTYRKALLTIGNEKIELPTEELYEPNFYSTSLHWDGENNILYITASNSDAAGSYYVLWIIENGKLKRRIIAKPF